MSYDYRSDPIGRLCLQLAAECKSPVGFGAVLVKNGRVIGRGRNRRATEADRGFFPAVDYKIDAEQAAVVDALSRGRTIRGGELFVLGMALAGPERGKLTIRTERVFVCRRCPHMLIKYDLPVNIPLISGWARLTPQEAAETAKRLCGKGYWKDFVNGQKSKEGKSV